jgi:hypothetical protein
LATTESTINDALAEVLRKTRKAWRDEGAVRSENTGLIKGSAKKPDLIIVEGNVSPVIIETEVVPGATVEAETRARLGEQLSASGQYIWSAIALRLPDRLRMLSGEKLRDDLATAKDLEMVLFSGRSQVEASRWPSSGWLQSCLNDLSLLAQSASIPAIVIEEAADTLVTGVSEAAALLNEVTRDHPGASEEISRQLCQEPGEQTRRMAMTIIANAFVFHENVARSEGALANVLSLDELRGKNGELSKSDVLNEWRKILKFNYWPIFDIARRILEVIPANLSTELIDRMATTAAKLNANNLMRSHDLTGAVFQKLIADRKFLAAYYTTPASAALLAGLAINPEGTLEDAFWSKPENVKGLRVADLACGTGTLLSTAYRRIGQLHELAGGDAEALHNSMMGNSLIGSDVLPSAAHLTASMLAGTHPTSKYSGSLIMTVGYGPQPKGGVALGSLELMDDQREFPIISITAKIAEGTGEKEEELWSKLQHLSFDLIMMNPPFTRATAHEGENAEVPNPMFSAFRVRLRNNRPRCRRPSSVSLPTHARMEMLGRPVTFSPLPTKG